MTQNRQARKSEPRQRLLSWAGLKFVGDILLVVMMAALCAAWYFDFEREKAELPGQVMNAAAVAELYARRAISLTTTIVLAVIVVPIQIFLRSAPSLFRPIFANDEKDDGQDDEEQADEAGLSNAGGD